MIVIVLQVLIVAATVVFNEGLSSDVSLTSLKTNIWACCSCDSKKRSSNGDGTLMGKSCSSDARNAVGLAQTVEGWMCVCQGEQDCSKKGNCSETFKCSSGNQVVSLQSIDDDFCDCDDGSDEPNTSACSGRLYSRFYCANTGLVATWIPSSRVNDGICDCCDGSDEPKGTCIEKCGEIAVRERQIQAEQAELFRRGKEAKVALEEQANFVKGEWKKYRLEVIATSDVVKDMIDDVALLLEEEEKQRSKWDREQLLLWARVQSRKLRLVQETDSSQNEEQKPLEKKSRKNRRPKNMYESESKAIWPEFSSSVSRGKPTEFLSGIRSTKITLASDSVDAKNEKYLVPLPQYISNLKDAMKKRERPVSKLSTHEKRQKTLLAPLLSKGASAWRFIGLAIVEAVGLVASPIRAFVEGLSWVSSTSFFQPVFQVFPSDITSPLTTFKFSRTISNRISRWASQTGVSTVWYTFWDAGPTFFFYMFRSSEFETLGSLSFQMAVLDHVHKSLKKHHETLIAALSDVDKRIAFDHGGNIGLVNYFEKCFWKHYLSYEWTLCLFKNAHQGKTLIGKFENWDQDSLTMKFTDGTACWNGPKRSLIVQFKCSPEETIGQIEEPQTCSYTMELWTPLAC